MIITRQRDAKRMDFSYGKLKELFSKNSSLAPNQELTLQITNIREIPNESGRRLRIILSDGTYSTNGVIRPDCVQAAESQGVKKGSIVKLVSYDHEKMTKNKRVVIVSSLQVVQASSSRIGQQSLVHVDEYFKTHPDEDKYLSSSPSERSASVEPPKPAAKPRQQETRNLTAIDQLSPYQNSWTIKARVSYKSDVRTWSNQRGEGKLFNVNLLDESNEIRATGFNDIVDKYFDLLQEGKAYYISKARIQQAKPQFSNLSHPYELQLDRDTVIEEVDDDSDVPALNFNFVPLNKVQDLETNSVIDCIGILKEVNNAFQITAKSSGRPFDRRDIVIVDDSNFAITVGLWNKAAVDFSLPEGTVVALKGAKVQDFGGRGLSLTQSATIMANPDIPESYKLKGWFDSKGATESFKSLKLETAANSSNNPTGKPAILARKSMSQVQDENLGMSEKPDFFNVKGTVNFIRSENFSYPACSSDGCNRKVIEQSDGTWRCEKCDVNHPSPNHRYILTVSVLDSTGQLWLTLFDDQARELIGMSAGELLELKENPDLENNKGNEFQSVLGSLQMSEFSFRVRARQDSYNGQTRVRYNVVGLQKLDYDMECEALCDILEGMF